MNVRAARTRPPQTYLSGAHVAPVVSTSALSIADLSKTFNGLKAVDALSLEVRKGEIYGFLGPNGAGKTTTIKIVLGLTFPDRGTVRVDGREVSREPHEIRQHIGFLPERVAFYQHLTARQTLEFFADLKARGRQGVTGLLEAVGLASFADAKVGTFSKGMVQLLGVAQALVGDPDLLILDEPTVGLDPNWTRAVKDRIQAANRAGTTVFFSSHILSEVQELAHRVGIVNRGRLVAEDTVERLGASLNLKPRLRISVDGDPSAAATAIAGLEGVEEVRSVGHDLLVVCPPATKANVIARLAAGGISVRDFRTEEPSLEEVFLRYTRDSRGSVR